MPILYTMLVTACACACVVVLRQWYLHTIPVIVCGCLLFTEVSGRLKLNVKLLVEVRSTMTSNYIDAAVYLCYIGSCHG